MILFSHFSLLILLSLFVYVNFTVGRGNNCRCFLCPGGISGWAQLSSSFDQAVCHRDEPVTTPINSNLCQVLWNNVTPTPVCLSTESSLTANRIVPILRQLDSQCPFVAPLHYNERIDLEECIVMIPPNPFPPIPNIDCPEGFVGRCAYEGNGISDIIPSTSITNTPDMLYRSAGLTTFFSTELVDCLTANCTATCPDVFPGWTGKPVCQTGAGGAGIGFYDPYLQMLQQFSQCGLATGQASPPNSIAGIYNLVAGCYGLANATDIVIGECTPENYDDPEAEVVCLYSLNKSGF